MSRSFSDPRTVFELIRSEIPITENGFKIGELTGEVVCLECEQSQTNIDEIPHKEDCGQRYVHSRYYVEALLST